MKSFSVLLICLGMLLIGSSGNAQLFTNFTTTNGLPDNNVNGVAIDHQNNKWFGTQNGVAKYDDVNWTVFTTANGLIDNYINCIAVDNDDHIWAGTDFGVSMYDGTTWTSFTTAQGLVNNQVNFISADLSGKVWFSTIGGLSSYDGTNWTTYTTANGLPNDMTSFVTPDSTSNLWIGTWVGGLAKFNGSTFQVFTTNDSLTSNNISAIAVTGMGEKWIGTFSGISVFDNSDEWIRNYRMADGLYNDYVQDLDFDSDGRLWIGTYADYLQDGAITMFNGTEWTSYTVVDGLIDPQVKRLAIDHSDNIWIATGSGVSRLNNPFTGVSTVSKDKGPGIYPNPADNFIFIDHLSKAGIQILDLTGKIIHSQNLSSSEKKIDIHQLDPGVYFIRMAEGNNTFTQKLIVK